MIFHTGLNKTGSTSLHKALNMLGFRSSHADERIKETINKNIENFTDPLSNIDRKLDAITDNDGIRYNLKYIYKYYPNSYYIETPRDMDGWLESRKNHVLKNRKNQAKSNFKNIYTKGWKELMNNHIEEVNKLSKKTEVLFLPISDENISDFEKWSLLCNYLGIDWFDCNKPFPVINKS